MMQNNYQSNLLYIHQNNCQYSQCSLLCMIPNMNSHIPKEFPLHLLQTVYLSMLLHR